jgi:hypothetical protein
VQKIRERTAVIQGAQRAGVTINDDVKSEIAALADAYSAAAEQAKALAKSQEEATPQGRGGLEDSSKDAFKGLVKDLASAKSQAEALLNALSKLSDKFLDMALDAVWESIFGPSRGNNFFSTLGKALTPQHRPAATTPAVGPDVVALTVKSISQATEQTFAAPVGKVERAALPPVSQIAEGLRGTISPKTTPQPTGTPTDALTKLASGGPGGDFASALLLAKGNRKDFVNL